VTASRHSQPDASRPSYKKPRSEHIDAAVEQRSSRQPAPQQRPQQQPRQPKRHPIASSASALRKAGVNFDFSRHDGFQPLAEDALAVLDSSCNSFVKREMKRAASMDRPACELTAKLQAAVSATWPGAVVICFGSRATGLAGAASDVDLVVVGVPDFANDPHPTVEVQLQALKKLLPCLEELPVKASIQKSSVPIIALEVTEGTAAGLKVDLSLQSARHSGIMAAQNICWLQAGLPALQPLTLILKELLRLHDLKSTYTGGLSSYALTNMVALFLLLSPMVRAERLVDAAAKGIAPPTAPPSSPAGSPIALATLLLEFLHFYGCLFDPATHALAWDRGINDEPVVVIGRRHHNGALAVHEHAPLLIFDALDATNNVGKCCYRFSLIQKVFRCAAVAGRASATAAAEAACQGVPPDAERIVSAMLAAADETSAPRAAGGEAPVGTEVKRASR
jgi:predicted nucleotidyltransferase